MELENLMTKKTYIQLLVDSSKKKLEVLKRLAEITEDQEALIDTESFDDSRFLHMVTIKEEQLKLLEELDIGFDRTFESIKEELIENKYRYEVEVRALQEYITEITDLSVKLQASELRNKTKLELLLTHKRKEIRNSRMNTQAVANYYKTMTKQGEVQSYFYDKKK